jgi:hypothetical protein
MRGLRRWTGLALAAAVFASPALLQAQESPECEVRTDLTAIPVSVDPVNLLAAHSDAVGEDVSAAFAEESGVEIVSIEQDPDNPLLLMLTLDTSGAASGDWELVIEGETARCVGEIEVADLEDIKPYQR